MTAPVQKRVLVVDDSSLMRRLITEIVEADPQLRVVDVAENGRIALQKVRELEPDCVLLDLEMPELSGLDTLRRLRLRSSAGVVVLSHLGQEGPRLRAEALRLGALEVIDKPTGAVSRDLRNTRGRIIRHTLRRVLGLPPVHEQADPLPPAGGSALASILAVDFGRLPSAAERLEATELVSVLNEHLALVHQVIPGHRGLIDGHLGGATLAAFGVPQNDSDHASQALAAADEILEATEALGAERRQAGGPLMEVGIAIVTGLVCAGELGPGTARRYRTVGEATDLAARLGRTTRGYGAELVICGRTLGALTDPVRCRRLDVVQLDPDGEPTTLYQVLSARSRVDRQAMEIYARGLEEYEVGHFAAAMTAFDETLRHEPLDRAAMRLLARCRALLRAPWPGWRGVWPLGGAEG